MSQFKTSITRFEKISKSDYDNLENKVSNKWYMIIQDGEVVGLKLGALSVNYLSYAEIVYDDDGPKEFTLDSSVLDGQDYLT